MKARPAFRFRRSWAVALCAAVIVCMTSETSEAESVRGGRARRAKAPLPPRGGAKLIEWLDAGDWRATYASEPAVHPSDGPHGGNVRTWYSPVLVDDLASGRPRFRRGAAMVKELFAADATTISGWAVMVKTRRSRSSPARAWYYYETFNRTGRTAIEGRGLGLCSSCHSSGLDYLRSTFRP